MPSTVLAAQALANGLRTEFWDVYNRTRIKQADGRLGRIMDLGKSATNRQHEFAQWDAAPHMEQWRRGDTIPTAAMGSTGWTTPVYNWARRIPWHKDDRKDDQTQGLRTMAAGAGQSGAVLPERFFFDIIAGTTNTLPGVPNAPDGAALYSTTTGGGANRFGITNGNLLTGTGVATSAAIRSDFYSAVTQAKRFQDGQGQPLFPDEITDAGVVIVFAAENLEVFEETFKQMRQGVVLGTDAGTTPSNLIMDASRRTALWGSNRLTGNDWYVFFEAAPQQPVYFLDRQGVLEFEALEGGNNSDHVRDTGEEYVQFESRSGAGVAEPYGTVKINN